MASAAYRSLLEHELQRSDARSIISIVHLMLADAQAKRASDIHVDPSNEGTLVRLRIDGFLEDSYYLPGECHAELIARLKILARLRIDEHFSPQDGRFSFMPPDKRPSFDVRLSILPSHHGESAVMRLLIPRENPDSLTALGLGSEEEQELQQALMRQHGMLLVVGPTGSGKTTTLYALMRRLAGTGRSIVSIEDPIEYSMPGVRQIQVMPLHGLTFADGLRSVLRQDPDVIMIGEIRDAETARLAANAAHTGHLVLSTLHAAHTGGAEARLAELGVPAERLSSIQTLFVGQRLVRLTCECRVDLEGECGTCNGSGYCGRQGVFDLLYA